MPRNYTPKTNRWRDVKARLLKYDVAPQDFALLAGISAQHMQSILDGVTKPDNRLMAILSLLGHADRRGRKSAFSFLHKHEHEWKVVPGFSRYEVSADGRVRRGHTELKRYLSADGYYKVTLYDDNKQQRSMPVHRAVCLTFNGEPESPSLFACHKDGDSMNNVTDNLYWGTAAENASDRVKHNRPGGRIGGRITWDRNGKALPPGKERTKQGIRDIIC